MTSSKKDNPLRTVSAADEEDSHEENKRLKQDEEEKLILSAWQRMSSALQLHGLCESMKDAGPAQSFLSKQRQSTLVRRALSSSCR